MFNLRKRHRVWLLARRVAWLFAVAVGTGAWASLARAAGTAALQGAVTASPAPVQQVLPNGMRVIVVPNELAVLTSLSIVYPLPNAPPSVRSLWLARIVRGLLPEIGTPHLSPDARRRLLLAADTSIERVRVVIDPGALVLTLSVPHDSLELASFIEADRMSFAAESLNQGMIDEVETSVASGDSRDELLRAWLDDAAAASSALLADETPSVAAGHVTVDELRAFMRRYLHPGNAILVIEGPLATKSVLDAVWRTFGKLASGERFTRKLTRVSRRLPAEFSLGADQRETYTAETRPNPLFLLSWNSTECTSFESCPLGVFAEWLSARLRTNSSAWCARVWVDQSWRSARFTVGCDTNAGFDADHWATHVSTVMRQFAEAPASPAELQPAVDRYRVTALSALSLPEHRASQLARQIARDEIPASSTLTDARLPSGPEIRESVLRHLLGNARGDVRVWMTEDQTAKFDTHTAEAQSESPLGYRPPKKARDLSMTLPKFSVKRLSANLLLRHLERSDAPVSRVLFRGLLRDKDRDPAIAGIALEALLRTDSADATLSERLWEECAVRASWDITASTVSLELTGASQSLLSALRTVSATLERAPAATSARLARAKDALLLRMGAPAHQSPLEELESRVGSPWVARVDPRRLVDFRTRVKEADAGQVQAMWADYAKHGEFAVSVLGPENLAQARDMALAALPDHWAHSIPRSRPATVKPRIWILDGVASDSSGSPPSNQVDIEVIWLLRETASDLRKALAVASIAKAAKALGNLNAARPHNPTTQFSLRHQSLPACDIASVVVTGIPPGRLQMVLRELEGYFGRLIARVDFPQLSRLGTHDLQRRQLGWFASPLRTLSLLDEWSLSGSLVWYPLESYHNLGLVPRDQLLDWSHRLALRHATIVARGPAGTIEPWLREVNRGELIVVSP